MNRKHFILSTGATCSNWTWSWSFVNHAKKQVIFGIWSHYDKSDSGLILGQSWQISRKGRKQPGYSWAIHDLGLVETKGYELLTFPMSAAPRRDDDSPSVIGSFIPELTRKSLLKVGTDWYAAHIGTPLPQDEGAVGTFPEGAVKSVTANAYERSAEARAACLAHYGYKCQVCDFDFAEFYAELGESYIHVHHVVPLHEIKQEYQVDPVKDLIPVCPNCHAIIHRSRPALSVAYLRHRVRALRSQSAT